MSMRPENPSESDQLLHRTLAEWQVNAPLPPRFRERVWQRIAREHAEAPLPSWAQLLNHLGAALSRPALAIGYVAALLLIGLLAGYWQARLDNARVSNELGARYVQMMTPYQTPRP